MEIAYVFVLSFIVLIVLTPLKADKKDQAKYDYTVGTLYYYCNRYSSI